MASCTRFQTLAQMNGAVDFAMVGFAVCALVCLALFILAFPFLWRAVKFSGVKESFKYLSRSFSGTFYKNGFRYPEVAIRKNGVLFRVRVTESKYNRLNQVLFITANWPERHFRLRLTPDRNSSYSGQHSGVQDLLVGDQEFDQAFIVQSNKDGSLSDSLSKEVQQALLAFLQHGDGIEFEIMIVGGVMSLRRGADVGTGRAVVSQVGDFVRIYQMMLTARALAQTSQELSEDDLKFLEPDVKPYVISDDSETESEAELINSNDENRIPVCQVCATEIESDRVECRSCDTAHHRDCWEYAGKCSTFACGEQRFRKTRKKRKKGQKRKKRSRYLGDG